MLRKDFGRSMDENFYLCAAFLFWFGFFLLLMRASIANISKV